MNISDIRTMDIFGVPPINRWENWACDVQGSRFFHCGLCVDFIRNKQGNIADWTTSESIGKGISLDRLYDSSETAMSRYRNSQQRFYIYRIKELGDVSAREVYWIHSKYGELPYSIKEDFDTAFWWLYRHYLHVKLPLFKEKGLNCVSWVALVAKELGVNLIPRGQYALEVTIEKSPLIEYIGHL